MTDKIKSTCIFHYISIIPKTKNDNDVETAVLQLSVMSFRCMKK